MTEEELQAIKGRAEAATPGPWRVDTYYDCILAGGKNICGADFDGDNAGPYRTEDAEFIAHARTDVPALVKEVRRLHKLLDEADYLLSLDEYDRIQQERRYGEWCRQTGFSLDSQ